VWLAVGLVSMLLVTTWAVVARPGSLRTPGAVILLLGLAALFVGYAAFVVVWWRRSDVAARSGACLGLAAGVLWLGEIAGGGPLLLDRRTEVINGAFFSLAAVAVTLSAGLISPRENTPRARLTAGLFAGVVSGQVVFVCATAMTLLTLPTLAGRPDYQQQFAHSGAPDIEAFLVHDALAGYGAHLVINPALGLVGVVIGAGVAGAVATRRAPS
jgi:hypothetical protein